jgi:hypothetical protein
MGIIELGHSNNPLYMSSIAEMLRNQKDQYESPP